jgi:hypothetical protein
MRRASITTDKSFGELYRPEFGELKNAPKNEKLWHLMETYI